VPEETNRRLVDHVADFNLVYTEHARRNLLAEGLHPRRVMLCGSPMREVLDHYRPQIEASDIVSRLRLEEGRYFLVSAHREENVDSADRLRSLLDCLTAVRDRWQFPIVVSTHPRTRERLTALGSTADLDRIDFNEPFGFFDYNRLQTQALCVLSDSGTISEESALLNFAAVTLRSSIERPEALEGGSMIMTGLRPDSVISGIEAALQTLGSCEVPQGYEVSNCSIRVRNFILSTAFEHANWAGLR
jgi:UDP-N-acetylglucosamine 2-epimerase (non-hydrolysing)